MRHFGPILRAGLCAGLGLCTAPALAAEISEIRIDQGGTDNDEYFELAGSPGESLNGLTYLVIGDGAAGSGVIEAVVSLDGQAINAGGFFVAAEDTFSLDVADLVTNLNFENNDNVTHLVVSGFSGTDGQDLDLEDDGILDIEPWTGIVDSIGIVGTGADPVYSTNIVGPNGTFVPAHIFRCSPDGTWKIGRFAIDEGLDSPGAANPACPAGDPCIPGAGSCFVPNGTPGCEDAQCCGDICIIDAFCCEFAWDQSCADAANLNCAGGDPCGLPDSGNCFLVNGTPGCDDAQCCGSVCLIDPLCCSVTWDQMCVDTALDVCAGVSGDWVINEIHADPAPSLAGDANGDGVNDSTQDEFIEIYNDSGTDVDISGWTLSDLQDVRHIFPAGSVVEADCTVVVFGGGTPIGGFGGALVQVSSETPLFLNNDGDQVTLADEIGTVQALVAYGPEGGNDASLTRAPDVTGTFQQHDLVPGANGARYSPGRKLDQTSFDGCTPPPPDFDMDGVPDDEDNCPLLFNPDQNDCDDDGVGDVCEIADGTQVDDNGNGLPDDCEVVPPDNLVINEIRIDHFGIDTEEYFELRGDPDTSLDGLTYIVIGDGAGSGTIETAIDLTGFTVPADGLFLCVEDTFTIASIIVADLVLEGGNPGGINFENSDNVTHLLVANFTGQVGQDIDTDDDGVLEEPLPWTGEVDRIALVEEENPPLNTEWHYGPPSIGPDGPFVPGHVFLCDPDVTWTIGQFDLDIDNDGILDSMDTPGFPNEVCPGDACAGDVDGSGVTDVTDLLLLLGAWGPCPGCPEDIDESGTVDVNDLLILLGDWDCTG